MLTRTHRWTQLFVLSTFSAPYVVSADKPSAGRIERCETSIRIGGSVYYEKSPGRSFALLYPAANKRGGVYRPGMRVDAYRLVAIEPRGILLQREDELCWLRLAPRLEAT